MSSLRQPRAACAETLCSRRQTEQHTGRSMDGQTDSPALTELGTGQREEPVSAQNRMLGPLPSCQLSAAPRESGLSWAELHPGRDTGSVTLGHVLCDLALAPQALLPFSASGKLPWPEPLP